MTPRPSFEAPLYKGAQKLKDKVAIVTGGDSGIGRSVAVLYAREGADVAIVYLPEERVDAELTRNAIENEGRSALLIPADVSDAKSCQRAIQKTLDEFGKIDILVNNAAFQQHQESIEDISDEQLERTFHTNIFVYFYMVRRCDAASEARGRHRELRLDHRSRRQPQLLDYSATKGAIHAFTKSLAQNLLDKGIRVNCVSPGPVWTPLNVADKEAKEVAQHGADVAMKRPAQPEEIAPAFVFFASEADSSYITGEVLTLLGGETTAA